MFAVVEVLCQCKKSSVVYKAKCAYKIYVCDVYVIVGKFGIFKCNHYHLCLSRGGVLWHELKWNIPCFSPKLVRSVGNVIVESL